MKPMRRSWIKLENLLFKSTLSGSHMKLFGSFLTTSEVLKMPWIEQALTLN